jgi:hypothetical protein
VLWQFVRHQEWSMPMVHTVLSAHHRWVLVNFKFNSAFEDFRRWQIYLICRRRSRRRVAGRVSWVQRVQSYVDGWATASQNVVTENRPHDDTTWEA